MTGFSGCAPELANDSDVRMSASGPGCVKTCTSRDCAELFSLFSSFDGDCQSGSFLIQCNRDKLSTRKFDVGVFTQPCMRTLVSSVTATLCPSLFEVRYS